ncbi:hypothetical protein [Nocardia paucivorans]|uniref:hypothetical protein n=1 Tax=Nocardia paucivorans TaxID=114259 RepID=UPI0002F0D9A6|nr:hypothetical protein [Nocardia paucivorans]
MHENNQTGHGVPPASSNRPTGIEWWQQNDLPPAAELMPPPPPGHPTPPVMPEEYSPWTRRPVRYLPVVRNGQLIGVLWGATSGKAAGYHRKLDADPDNITCPGFWYERLTRNYRQGLTPLQAIRSWIGVPEDPRCGGIPPHAVESEATTIQELWDRINPEGPPLGNGPWLQDGELPDGSPWDRSQGWSTPHSVVPPTYAQSTDTAVHYYPVTLNGTVVGYLWASPTDQAAQYLPRTAAGRQGTIAAGLWQLRLSDSYAAGLPALEAIRRCRNYPPDFLSGAIDPNTPEQQLPSLNDLLELAHNQ